MMRNATRTICLKISAMLAIFLMGTLPATHAAERITYYHTDALGSPVAATDQLGNVVWRESYEPYGARIKKEPAASTNARWHTGHVLDAETGLQYAGARYYDPVLGRFMGVDPAAFTENNPHSFNRYNYGNNNPYKYVDPDGRAAETVLDVISLGLSINEYRQNPSFWNGVGVAVDAVGTAVPFVPAGVGSIRQIGKAAAHGGDAAKSPDFVVSPGGTAFPVPKGSTGPTPVINKAGKETGTAFTGGAGGQNGQVEKMRIMDPNKKNPSGYIKYENNAGQGVDPYSGRTASPDKAHIPVDR